MIHLTLTNPAVGMANVLCKETGSPDGTVEATFDHPNNLSGVAWRVVDADNYCLAAQSQVYGTFVVGYVEEGDLTVVTNTDLTGSLGRLKVSVTGDVVEVYLNDVLVLTTEDLATQFPEATKFGVCAHEDWVEQAEWVDVRVNGEVQSLWSNVLPPSGAMLNGTMNSAINGTLPDLSPAPVITEVMVTGEYGKMGTLSGEPTTLSGETQSTKELPDGVETAGLGMQFFFGAQAADGSIGFANLPATGSQVSLTGKAMTVSFWHPDTDDYYTVQIPTTLGEFYAPALSDPTAGGADTSDGVAITIDSVEYLFFLSAINDWHWDKNDYGYYPRIAAFRRFGDEPRWQFDPSMSIYDSDLAASTAPYDGFAFVLPAEIDLLPASNHLVVTDYGLDGPALSGRLVVIDPVAKEVTVAYQWPDMQTTYVSGGGSGHVPIKAFPRDVATDPTSVLGDERIGVVPDCFRLLNEKYKVQVYSPGATYTPGVEGEFRLSFDAGGEEFTADLPYYATAEDVQAALEALTNIDPGWVFVRKTQPFLVDTYGEFYIEFIGAKEASNLLAQIRSYDLNLSGAPEHYATTTKVHDGSNSSYTERAPFFFQEFTYDADNKTLEPTCAPILPTSYNREHGEHGELYGDHFGFARYDNDGNLWLSTAGVYSETQYLKEKAYSVWVNPGGDLAFVADAPPSAGWEDDIFTQFPSPTWEWDGVNQASYFKGIVIDPSTGSLLVNSSDGVIHGFEPVTGLVNLTTINPNPNFDTDLTGWTTTGGASVWGSGAATITANGTDDAKITTPTGLSGFAVPGSAVGRPLFARAVVSQTSGTTRYAYLSIGCYDDAGLSLDPLLSIGPKIPLSGSPQEILAWRAIPADTEFLAITLVILDAANTETFVVDSIEFYSTPILTPPDIEIDFSALELDFFAFGTTKGVVNDFGRRFRFPIWQSASSAAAAKLLDIPQFIGDVDIDVLLDF